MGTRGIPDLDPINVAILNALAAQKKAKEGNAQ